MFRFSAKSKLFQAQTICRSNQPYHGRRSSELQFLSLKLLFSSSITVLLELLFGCLHPSGDNITTAKAIARECRILTEGHKKKDHNIEGRVRNELRELIQKIQIMARSSPLAKHILVKNLRRSMGEVVAVTGDDANDAPAFQKADMGLAMQYALQELRDRQLDTSKERKRHLECDVEHVCDHVLRWNPTEPCFSLALGRNTFAVQCHVDCNVHIRFVNHKFHLEFEAAYRCFLACPSYTNVILQL